MLNVHPKVAAATVGAGIGSAVADLIVWGLRSHGVVVPDNVAQDLDVIVSALISFVSGYYTPSPS